MSAMDIYKTEAIIHMLLLCIALLPCFHSVVMLSPHPRHNTSLLSASEEAQELEETRHDRKREHEHKSLERLYLDDEASTNLESRGQWSAEPTAPCRLLFSESRTGSENQE